MRQVLLVWTESNPSTMEKEFLLLNGLQRCSVPAHAIGFSHSRGNKQYYEKVYAEHALYTYTFGSERALFQGRNLAEKLISNLRLSAVFALRLFTWLRANRPSVIIIPPQPLELTLPALLLGKAFGAKVIPNIMEYEPALPSYHKRKNIFQRWSWSLVARHSDAYIVISGFLDEKIRHISSKPIFRLPGILPSRPVGGEARAADNTQAALKHIPRDKPILIFTSSRAYDDLLEFCLAALAELQGEDYLLVVTGTYPRDAQETWLSKARARGLDGKIIFSGFLSDEEMLNLQLHSSALLIPLLDNDRHRARFPQKILGYMRLGKPTITTRVGDLGDYFKDGDTVLMDDSVTPRGYADRIRFALKHPDEADAIGTRGSQYVAARFNETTLAEQLKYFLSGLDNHP